MLTTFLSSLPLSQLRPVRVTYPDTIDVDLPDSFLEDDGIQPVSHKVKKRQDKLVWSEQRADEQFPGCHPNVMLAFLRLQYLYCIPANFLRIRRYAAVPRLSTISITFIKAPPPLLRLPVEIRLQILGHLLTSEHPIINPYVNRPREPEEKWSVDARILRTCPCMYTEGRWILYQSNTFRFTEQAAFDTWRLSQHRIHRHVRHLELHTKVAEKFCYRRVRVQGQTMQLFRVRIPAGWDWPFANPWHFTHLHTLKLDLKDFDSLPVTFSSRKQQAGPDPDARNPRVPPVTKRDLLAYIRKASNAPLLMDVEVAGATYSLQILLFELSMRVLGFCRILDYNTRCREMTSYLEERIGGRWETQDLATRMNWENLKRALSRSVDQAAQRGETKRYENYRVDYDFALLMWMRKRHAERSSTKA